MYFKAPAGIGIQLPSSSSSSHPLLTPLTIACSIIALTSYNTKSVGALAFVVFLGSAVIAGWGWWTVSFVFGITFFDSRGYSVAVDHVFRHFIHLAQDWCGQANLCFLVRKQGSSIDSEEGMEEGEMIA